MHSCSRVDVLVCIVGQLLLVLRTGGFLHGSHNGNSIVGEGKAVLNTLQQVHVLFRHGERTAIGPLVSDSDPRVLQEMKSDGAGGWGQLTNLGKKQTFELGEYFRRRYAGFTSEDYNSKEVYILSSDSERTLKSAGAFALGFYKEFHERASWNPDFLKTIEPIPIRTIPAKDDRMLKNTEKCVNRQKWFEDIFSGPYWKEVFNSELMNYVKTHSGDPTLNDPTKSHYVQGFTYIIIQDNLLIKKIRNETRPTLIPSWAIPLFDREEFTNIKGRTQLDELRSTQERRLISGPLFQYLRDNIDRKLKDDKEAKKMIFLSGHDRNMASLLTSLDMFHPNVKEGMPTFASSLMIELHRSPDQEFFLQFWMRNDTTREPYYLPVPHCGEPCYYKKFKDLISGLIPSDWTHECNDPTAKNNNNAPLQIGSSRSSSTIITSNDFIIAILTTCVLTDFFTRRIHR